jgi:hypothetical protein
VPGAHSMVIFGHLCACLVIFADWADSPGLFTGRECHRP